MIIYKDVYIVTNKNKSIHFSDRLNYHQMNDVPSLQFKINWKIGKYFVYTSFKLLYIFLSFLEIYHVN